MKFTIARADVEFLLKAIVSRRHAAKPLTLSACAARVFAECKGDFQELPEGHWVAVCALGLLTVTTVSEFS